MQIKRIISNQMTPNYCQGATIIGILKLLVLALFVLQDQMGIQKPSLQQQQQQSRRVADISKDLCQAATFWTPIHKRGYWCHVKTSSSFLQAKNRFLHYQTRKLEEVVNSLSEIPKAKHAKVSKYYKVCQWVQNKGGLPKKWKTGFLI